MAEVEVVVDSTHASRLRRAVACFELGELFSAEFYYRRRIHGLTYARRMEFAAPNGLSDSFAWFKILDSAICSDAPIGHFRLSLPSLLDFARE